MTKIALSMITCAAVTLTAHAEVVPLNKVVKPGQNYLVPSGKTLIFTMAVIVGSSSPRNIKITPAGALATDFFEYQAPYRVNGGSLNEIGQNNVLYFQSGTKFESTSGSPTFSFLILGRLADNSDLFASVPSTLRNPQDTGTELAATAEVDSPRPVRLDVEESTNLGFTPAPDATVAKISPDSYDVAIDKNGDPKKFLRVEAIARPQD